MLKDGLKMLELLRLHQERLYTPKYAAVLGWCVETVQQRRFGELLVSQAPSNPAGNLPGCSEEDIAVNAEETMNRVCERHPGTAALTHLLGVNRALALTPGFIQSCATGKLHQAQRMEVGPAWLLFPTLKVVAHTELSKKRTIHGSVWNEEHIIFGLEDGSGKIINASVASYAAYVPCARRLRNGDLIVLDSFSCGVKGELQYYDQSETQDSDEEEALMLNLVIQRFRLVRKASGEEKPHADPDTYASLDISASAWRRSCRSDDDEDGGDGGDDEDDDGDDDEDDDDDDDAGSVSSLLPGGEVVVLRSKKILADKVEPVPVEDPENPGDVMAWPIRCDGKFCTKHGVVQGRCIALQFPPLSLTDMELQEGYPGFVDAVLTPNLRRHLRYYHYATQFYFACGVGVRVRLPYCLVARIRFDFPNGENEPYMGFIDV